MNKRSQGTKRARSLIMGNVERTEFAARRARRPQVFKQALLARGVLSRDYRGKLFLVAGRLGCSYRRIYESDKAPVAD